MCKFDLIGAGIVGVMLGLAVADVLQFVWNRECQGDKYGAYAAFLGVPCPILYGLQSLEFLYYAGKPLLTVRGTLPATIVQEATLTVGDKVREHIEFLNWRVPAWLGHLGLPTSGGSNVIVLS